MKTTIPCLLFATGSACAGVVPVSRLTSCTILQQNLEIPVRGTSRNEGKIACSGPPFHPMTSKDARAVLKGLTVAGSDGEFLPVDASVRGDAVGVSNPTVRHLSAVHYGWANVPEANPFNKEGLPAAAFRTSLSEIHH